MYSMLTLDVAREAVASQFTGSQGADGADGGLEETTVGRSAGHSAGRRAGRRAGHRAGATRTRSRIASILHRTADAVAPASCSPAH